MAKRQMGIEEIAAEVGRLFGTTEAHAKKWLNQRRSLLDSLRSVRDKSANLISELGGDAEGTPVIQPGMRESRKRRIMSAQTRAKMRAAAKKRWSQIKKSTKGAAK